MRFGVIRWRHKMQPASSIGSILTLPKLHLATFRATSVTPLLCVVQIMESSKSPYCGKFNDTESSTVLPFFASFQQSYLYIFNIFRPTVSSESYVTFPLISRLLKAVIVYSRSAPVKLSPAREVHERLLKGFSYLLFSWITWCKTLKQSLWTQYLFVT